MQWQGTKDCTWERASARPFPKLNQTWADTPVVEQYVCAKAEGRLLPEVSATTKLLVPRQRGGKGGVRVKLSLAVLNAPDDAPVDFRCPQTFSALLSALPSALPSDRL